MNARTFVGHQRGHRTAAPAPVLTARGSGFITSASNAAVTLLVKRPELAQDAGVEIDWVTVRGAQASMPTPAV